MILFSTWKMGQSGSVADIQAVLDPVITSFGITPAEFGSTADPKII